MQKKNNRRKERRIMKQEIKFAILISIEDNIEKMKAEFCDFGS